MDEPQQESSSAFWKEPIILGALAVLFAACIFMGVRASTRARTSSGNPCIPNLRQLDGAVQQWALENKKSPGDLVTSNDIAPFLRRPLVCSGGGKYTIGPALSNGVTCSFPGHVLPP